MRTAHLLTDRISCYQDGGGGCACHTCPPAMHASSHTHPQPHISPGHACPQPCMALRPPATQALPLAMHALLAMHAPHHAYSLAMHTPQPCMPPVTSPPATHAWEQTPSEQTPLGVDTPLRADPQTRHPPGADTPQEQTSPLWTEFLTHASENITLPQLRCGR